MSNDYPRSHRVADFIQRELADLIQSELKDPRLSPMLTLSSVEVSRDLAYARIYYTLLDSDGQGESQAALESASGFLRRQLARRMNTRSVPQLRFIHDDSNERGARMSALIDAAVETNTTDPVADPIADPASYPAAEQPATGQDKSDDSGGIDGLAR